MTDYEDGDRRGDPSPADWSPHLTPRGDWASIDDLRAAAPPPGGPGPVAPPPGPPPAPNGAAQNGAPAGPFGNQLNAWGSAANRTEATSSRPPVEAPPPDDLLAAVGRRPADDGPTQVTQVSPGPPAAPSAPAPGPAASNGGWATQVTQAGPSSPSPSWAPGAAAADRTLLRPPDGPGSPWAPSGPRPASGSPSATPGAPVAAAPSPAPGSPGRWAPGGSPVEPPPRPPNGSPWAPAPSGDAWPGQAGQAGRVPPPSPAYGGPPPSPPSPYAAPPSANANGAGPADPGVLAGPAVPGGTGVYRGAAGPYGSGPGASGGPSPYGQQPSDAFGGPADTYARPNPGPAVPPSAYPHPQREGGSSGYPSAPGYGSGPSWGGPPPPPGGEAYKFRPGVGAFVGLLGLVALILSFAALPWVKMGGIEVKFSDFDSNANSSFGAADTSEPSVGLAPGEFAGAAQQDPSLTTTTLPTFNTVSPTFTTDPSLDPSTVDPSTVDASDYGVEQWKVDYMNDFVDFGWIAVIAVAALAVLLSTILVPSSHGGRMATGFLQAGIIGFLVNAADRRGSVGPRLSGTLAALIAATGFGIAVSVLFGTDPAPDMGTGVWAGIAGLALIVVGCIVGARRRPASPGFA